MALHSELPIHGAAMCFPVTSPSVTAVANRLENVNHLKGLKNSLRVKQGCLARTSNSNLAHSRPKVVLIPADFNFN